MASSDNSKTLSPFDLPTHQRRLRHFKSLAVRNLVCKGYMGREVVKLQTYFTLHKDAQSKAFYTSEKITGSLNPSWQSFDLSRLNEEVDMAAKFVVVRVWGGHDKKTRLLVEWQVHFSGLVFLTEKLQKDGMKFATNSLVFGLFEKYFSIPAEENKQEAVCDPSSSLRLSTLTVEQVTVHNSYTVSSLSRIHTILRAIQQTQVTVHRVHHSIEDRLLASQEKAAKLSEREALLLKVNQLRGELRWQTSQSQAERDKRDRQKVALKQRGALLKENYSTMGSKYDSLQAQRQQHIATRENLVKTNAQLNMRRRQLIEELATHIYPITQLPNSKGHAICGVILPNAEEFQGHDDYSIAVALGYTCHMVLMMSQFLDTPLWYPMVHRGSKSVIRDHIISKLSERDRDFVLYGKNKDKIQFHYGVYLLNKNISQLRYQYGLATQDLRLTLQNLLSLLELRLGLKFDSSRVPVPVALNSSSRQLSVDTAYSQQGKEGVADDHHGNDLTDGPTHSNQEQMIEQLIQESRAMTGETSNTNWAENLNSKPTWSLQNNSDSSFNDVDSNKDSTDIFKPSPGGIFHEEKSEYKQNGKHQNYVDDSAISKHNGLDGDNITGEDILSSKVVSQGSQNIKDDLKENVVPKSGSFTDITRTDEVLRTSSENIAVESVSTGEPSEGVGDTVSQKQSSPERVSGTFKTSAFKKVPRIDSSEEVTEDAQFSTSSDNIPSLPKYQASYDHDIH